MRVVLQRVSSAKVTLLEKVNASIEFGLLVLVGIEEADTVEDCTWLSQKIINLRIFPDQNGVMNLSVKEINGEILVISQFTLHAATKKGNRPSYLMAAKPEIAKKIGSLKEFDMRPYFIEKRFKLRTPIYSETASYGHMGRTSKVVEKVFNKGKKNEKKMKVKLFPWEELNALNILKKEFGIK